MRVRFHSGLMLLLTCPLSGACSDGAAGETDLGSGGQLVAGATGGDSSTGGLATGGTVPETGGRSSGGSATGGLPMSTGGEQSATGGAPAGGTSGGASGGAAGGAGGSGGQTAVGGSGSGGDRADDDFCPPGVERRMVVAEDGTGDFSSVGMAVASIPAGSNEAVRIDVRAGTYKEKLTIADRRNLCLVGEDALTTILTFDDNNESAGGTSASASTTITADDFSAARLTFANSRPEGSGQAVALLTDGERQQFLDCRFLGFQDTLYPRYGTQYFRGCYVEGTVDFIFGGASAVFDDCEVVKVGGGVAITAPSTPAEVPFGLVFLGGKMTSTAGGSTALGRPWRENGMSAFIEVELGSHIESGGFTEMSGNLPQNARFGEYESSGAGANPGARAAYQLGDAEAANYTIENILPGWTPSYSE